MTQERLAWACGISKPYLSQVEAGKRLPSLTTLALISKRLKVELADLLVLDLKHPRLQLLEATRQEDQAGVKAALRELDLG